MDLAPDEQDRPTVLSFTKTASGGMGPAEKLGTIQIGDALVKCNDEELDNYDFTDSIAVVVGQPWPRSMVFERPATEPVPDAEGWLFKQGDSAKSALRRRMFKLYGDTLFYYKPSRLNASKPTYVPSGHIKMGDVVSIKTFYDKRQDGNKQYRMELHTKNRVWVLCPNSVDGLSYWSPILSASTGETTPVPSQPLEVIEKTGASGDNDGSSGASGRGATVVKPDGPLIHEGPVRRKDFFTEACRPRQLKLHLNRLLFHRTDLEGARVRAPYSVDVDDLKRAARLINPSAPMGMRDTVRLVLKDESTHEFMCDDTDTAVEWINMLRGLGAKRSAADSDDAGEGGEGGEGEEKTAAKTTTTTTTTTLDVVQEAEDVAVSRERVNSQMTLDELESRAEEQEEMKELAHETEKKKKEVVDHVKTSRSEGWLHKLGENESLGTGNYRKRWFSLQKNELPYYKHRAVGLLARGAAGRIDFKHVVEVRQSSIPGCPDNTIEIVTPGRVYTVVPHDDANDDVVFDNWILELTNAADIYGADYVEAQKVRNFSLF